MSEQLFNAARMGDATGLSAMLDEDPEGLDARMPPYEWTLLHVAAAHGHLNCVDLLLKSGMDVDVREKGDDTSAMHWAAAGGHLEVVQRLVDAGGDIIGRGDDHGLEVIGWATCWNECHDEVAQFLVGRGARHHIFSAIAMNLPADVRRIVAADPATLNRRMSRNEDHQLPLHFAVRKNRQEMVALLLDLGADPLAVDGSGYLAAAHATSPHIDRRVMQAINALTSAEMVSAERGRRQPRASAVDLLAMLALGDWDTAARLVREIPRLLEPAANEGVLHLMAKRNDVAAVKWLLERGANPGARWAHWDAEVTPLHLAVLGGHAGMVRLLLEAGADPRVRDGKHDGDAIGWAEFFQRPDLVQILESHAAKM